jgi:hypothetical protein
LYTYCIALDISSVNSDRRPAHCQVLSEGETLQTRAVSILVSVKTRGEVKCESTYCVELLRGVNLDKQYAKMRVIKTKGQYDTNVLQSQFLLITFGAGKLRLKLLFAR